MAGFADYATEKGDFKPFERAVAGQYLCELISIEPVDRPKWVDNVKTDKMELNFLFIYEAKQGGKDAITGEQLTHTDSEGKPFQFREYVRNTEYGFTFKGSTGKLTLLLDKLIGRRLTTEEFKRLAFDKIAGNKYLLDVELKEGEKSYNFIKHVRIHPRFPVNVAAMLAGPAAKTAAAPAPAPVADMTEFRAEQNVTRSAPAPASKELDADPFAEDDPFADN